MSSKPTLTVCLVFGLVATLVVWNDAVLAQRGAPPGAAPAAAASAAGGAGQSQGAMLDFLGPIGDVKSSRP